METNSLTNTVSGLERLSGDYIRGYTKAIQDMQKIFLYVGDDLLFHKKKITMRLAQELLSCCLDNREKLRENKGFIRWNCITNKFEWFAGKEK